MTSASQPVAEIGALLESAGIDYAVIGGHAVNVWLEPRFTADVDITIATDRDGLDRLHTVMDGAGFRVAAEHGADQPSGPDFVRFVSARGDILEIQIAKTSLQVDVVRRAQRTEDGIRVATAEDLIVLKLIAHRRKDRVDLVGLCALPGLDWAYVERWAEEWEVTALLDEYRG